MKKKFLLLLLFIPLLASCNQKEEPKNEDPQITEPSEDKKDDVIENKDGKEKDEKVLSDLELKDYKSTFNSEEEFSVGNLKVYAVYSNGEKTEVKDYTVDSSKFDNTKAGQYEITITYSQHKKSYTVNVGGQVDDLPWV